MRTWAKIAIGVAATALILLVIALITVRWRVDPGDYRARIDAAVSDAVGRDVAIDGPIRLSLLPWPSVTFRSVTIANAPGFGDRPLARIRAGHVTLRALPLLTGHLRLGTLDINGLELRLQRDGDGRTNWQGVVRRLSSTTPDPERGPNAVKARAMRADNLPISSLSIDAVEISNADVRYDDDARDRHYRLQHAELETGRISNGHPFRLEASGDLARRGRRATAAVHLASRVEPNIADRFYRFSGLSVNVLAHGAAVPGGEQEANLGASGDLDVEAGRFGLDNVVLQGAGLNITGKIDGTGLNDRLAYNGRITVAQFSPRSVLQQLAMHPPHTESGSALASASFDAQFEGGADAVHFKQIAARLDDSTLSGAVDVHDFARPRYHFDLNLDTLDIDDYLPPGSAAQARTNQPAQGGDGAARTAAEFDLAPLHHLRMQGRLRIGTLDVADLAVHDAIARITAGDGVLRVAPLTADLYGGFLRLSGAIDARAGQAHYRLAGRLRNVAVKPLLTDIAGSHRLEGSAGATIDLRAEGRQVAQLKRSLSGRARFALDHGRINGFDLIAWLRTACADGPSGDPGSDQSSHQSSEYAGAHKTTAFRHMGGRFAIDRGVATSRGFSIDAGDLSGHGQGRYSLPDNRLDYTLRLHVPDQAGKGLGPLAGRTVSMRLNGPLLAPSYRVGKTSRDDQPAMNPDRKTPAGPPSG